MELRVAAPGNHLTDADVDRIRDDLAKIDRRFAGQENVFVEVRIGGGDAGASSYQVTLKLEYGRNLLVAKAENQAMGQAVRRARDEILRQINDRSRRGHSSFTKNR